MLDLIKLWYELLHRKHWRGSRQTLAEHYLMKLMTT